MRPLSGSPEWLRVTLHSIGDAVIATDAQARITFLNPVAQQLTGWTIDEAAGVALDRVFRIVNEETRTAVESPSVRALREGVVVGLANHTILIAKDGTERHIDDSAAPIRDAAGSIVGVVLVFRDIGDRRVLEKQRADALAYAEAILATLRHPFLVLDADLRVQSASVSFYRSFQTNAEETLGRSVYALGNGQWDIPDLRTLLNTIGPSQISLEDVEIEHDFPKIGRRTFALNGRSIHDGEPHRVGLILLVMEDITDRKRMTEALRDSEIRYRRLFQSAKDGILILDPVSGKILDGNAFMCGLTGLELAELVGKQLHEIGLFSDVDANKLAFAQLQERGYVRYDHLPIRKANGDVTEVEFISNVYREDHVAVAQCNIRDISARVALENQIKAQSLALADQHRRKDEFLAMLSHELRNPLAPIRSATHLLRLQELTENPIARQAREVIERQVTHLTRLVNDLLEVSRVVSGRIHIQRQVLDLCEAVRHGLETVTPLITRQGLEVSSTFSGDEPAWVDADPTRLDQIVVNLLTNAAKFTNRGGQIRVTVEREGSQHVLRVRDSGIGIAATMLPHIFDLFSQADRSLERTQGGLGIGLSVVEKLVQMHGGTVEARSDGLGKGSEFIVRLPSATAPGIQLAAPNPVAETHDAPKGKVLVVDDNADACAMLANFLRIRGYAVQMAHTGPLALANTQAWKPDIVLLDIGLPQLDGYEVARRMRADPSLDGLKLVAITGYGNEKDVHLAHEAGFDAHMLKPVDPGEVEALLATWSVSPTR